MAWASWSCRLTSSWSEISPSSRRRCASSRSRLILALLEPQAPDSLAAWGMMNSVFFSEGAAGGRGGRGGLDLGEYLSEPIARKMMADQPELRKQFEAQVAAERQSYKDALGSVLGVTRPLWFEPGYTSLSRMLASRSGIRSVGSLNELAHLSATRDTRPS